MDGYWQIWQIDGRFTPSRGLAFGRFIRQNMDQFFYSLPIIRFFVCLDGFDLLGQVLQRGSDDFVFFRAFAVKLFQVSGEHFGQTLKDNEKKNDFLK